MILSLSRNDPVTTEALITLLRVVYVQLKSEIKSYCFLLFSSLISITFFESFLSRPASV